MFFAPHTSRRGGWVSACRSKAQHQIKNKINRQINETYETGITKNKIGTKRKENIPSFYSLFFFLSLYLNRPFEFSFTRTSLVKMIGHFFRIYFSFLRLTISFRSFFLLIVFKKTLPVLLQYIKEVYIVS